MDIIKVYTDASVKDIISIGIYIINNCISITSKRTFKLNTNDCNKNICMAELLGINAGLEFCLKSKYDKFFRNKEIIVYNDNLTAINKIKNKKTKMCKKNIKKIESELKSKISFEWIKREENKIADSLCKKFYKYNSI